MTLMKRNPQYALRRLLHDTLDGKIVYDSREVRIFDAVPKGEPFPYIVIGDASGDPVEDKTDWEELVRIELAVLSLYGGTTENIKILDLATQVIATAAISYSLQFMDSEGFCVISFTFGGWSTKGVIKEEVEESLQELQFLVQQTI